jgi:hypothetical protein
VSILPVARPAGKAFLRQIDTVEARHAILADRPSQACALCYDRREVLGIDWPLPVTISDKGAA